MEVWFIALVSLCVCLLFRALFNLSSPSRLTPLPPGPSRIPIISNILFLRKSFLEIESLLRNLSAKYGPIFSLRVRSRPLIFVADRFIAHQALVQNGAVFSDRPKALITSKIFSSDQHDISSACYGPTWRVLRRNLAFEMLHPARIKSFSGSRKWVLDLLVSRLKADSESSNSIKVIDHLQYAMFCLLVFMCFGEKLDEKQIRDIEHVEQRVLLSVSRFRVLNFWPRITRILFRKRWQELLQTRKEQESVLIPLIRARKKAKEDRLNRSKEDADSSDQFVVPYVDTLLDLEWPEEKRKLEESEIVSVSSEFLNAGTDTTATALQWIMANLVKHPHIPETLAEEIRDVIGDREEKEVKEDDLNKLPYLKAVILEGLRRHPPAHFVLPHAVKEDVVLNGFLIPKNGTINFLVADMGWDPKVWENPMEFKPERFLNSEKHGDEGFDITGSKEIKMMPFGAGRRICPGYNLAMFHLEYFVANLVWNFKWKASNDGVVDLSEKQAFTVMMKNPLQVHISPRIVPPAR
ncbi:cytochrome P450 89A2-like [Prosopis cineraria]|uniref:cytochrome P450 89A2-like n=1 Tax=Prosopis cineraria TaxID=364024 RepID=UPI00240F49D4|nr:cytochrome P450 89A2-like [Prosopis cineraria]